VPNNCLLVSIAQAFGAEVYSFGRQFDTTKSTGRLAEL